MAGNKTVKSPIVYYGVKTSMLSHILPMIPPHEVYTEPFFGGGAVFFSKAPVKNETINDNLDLVINFYRILRTNFEALKKLVDATLISRKIHREALTNIRAHARGKKIDPVVLAWSFWLCTNFAYSNKIGGGYKYSNDMCVSVPDTLSARKLNFNHSIVKRIEHAYIECEDALKLLRSRNVIKAFHYIDPPYMNADQGHYSGYTEENFRDLLNFLSSECKGRFILSNFNSDILSEFINRSGWHKKEIIHRIKAPSKIVRDKTEVLVWNYDLTPSLFPEYYHASY